MKVDGGMGNVRQTRWEAVDREKSQDLRGAKVVRLYAVLSYMWD